MLDNEKMIVEQARQDPMAFGALYDHYVDRIFAYTVRLVQDEVMAQDVTAVAFQKALRKIRRYEWQNHSFADNGFGDTRLHILAMPTFTDFAVNLTSTEEITYP